MKALCDFCGLMWGVTSFLVTVGIVIVFSADPVYGSLSTMFYLTLVSVFGSLCGLFAFVFQR